MVRMRDSTESVETMGGELLHKIGGPLTMEIKEDWMGIGKYDPGRSRRG